MNIHHVGYLVENIEEAVKCFSDLGGIIQDDIVFDENRLVYIAFVKLGDSLIELVSPRSDSQDVGKSLRRLKSTPYHLCFECRDLNETVRYFESLGAVMVKEPKEAVGLNNRKVAFLYNDKIGLFELLESENKGE